MLHPSPRYCLSLSLRLSFALSLFLLLSHSSTFLFLISCLCHLCLWKFDNGFLFFLSVNPPAHLSLSDTPGEEISSGLAAKKKLNKAFLQGDCSVYMCVSAGVCVYACVCSDGMLIKDDVILHISQNISSSPFNYCNIVFIILLIKTNKSLPNYRLY